MANVRLVFPNTADSSTLTTSPASVASMPVSNLQTLGRAKLWRYAGTSVDILGELNAYATLSALAIVRHNLTVNATIRLQLYQDSAQGGAVTYDSGVLPLEGSLAGWGDFAWGVAPWGLAAEQGWPVPTFSHWFSEVQGLSFRITISDPGNADGFVQASRLVLGRYWSPSVNMAAGLTLAWGEASKQTRSDGGTLRTDVRDPFRRITFNLNYMSPSERASFMEIARRAGVRNDVFVSCFPTIGGDEERDYEMLAKFTSPPEAVSAFISAYKTAITVEEC